MLFFFFVFCFVAGIVQNLVRPKYPKKLQNPKYMAKKAKKAEHPFVKGSAGAHETRMQKFMVFSLENGVDICKKLVIINSTMTPYFRYVACVHRLSFVAYDGIRTYENLYVALGYM